jgi:hypothetical protein
MLPDARQHLIVEEAGAWQIVARDAELAVAVTAPRGE